MWTEKHRVDAAADLAQRLVHFLVDGVQRGDFEQAAPDARLIGGDHYVIAIVVEPRNRFKAAWDRFPFGGRFDVLGAVEVDHAVAIKNDEFHAASFEMSATRFMLRRKSLSSAKRLRRRSASSAMTMTESKNASTGFFKIANALR